MTNYEVFTDRIRELIRDLGTAIIGIDGMSCAGKTTFVQRLASDFRSSVIHMDDFYLPIERRTDEIMAQPGGNMDFERLNAQVTEPLLRDMPVVYGVFDCSSQSIVSNIVCDPEARLIIIEGAYALHPLVPDIYDLRVFATVSPELQTKRIIDREGAENAESFISRWVSRENTYFSEYMIPTFSDLVCDLSRMDEQAPVEDGAEPEEFYLPYIK